MNTFFVRAEIDNRDSRIINNAVISFEVRAETIEEGETYAYNYMNNVLRIVPLTLNITS